MSIQMPKWTKFRNVDIALSGESGTKSQFKQRVRAEAKGEAR